MAEKGDSMSVYRPPAPISNPSKLLLRYRFWNKAGAEKLASLTDAELDKKLREMSDDEAEGLADEHHVELASEQMFRTGYPKPQNSYRLIYETFQKPAEAFYFWCLNHFRDLGFPVVDKIIDVFTASEQSAFYGASQQRLSLHEDKVSQYLATIGRMVKELFQVVREIRIIKERLGLYRGAMGDDQKIREHNEVALKGLYVDMVEGGAKSPASVFGMASQLQFTALPELFFTVHPKSEADIERLTNEKELKFNENIRTVLKRKLASYLHWRNATYVELMDRESHTIRYLRQHYDAIQMYMTWVKPYLRHIKRLQMSEKQVESPDIIGAFEGSVIEAEMLARRIPRENKTVYECVLLNMTYRTSPTMSFSKEGRHQGPLHMGRIDCTWRSYMWTEKDIANYKAMREAETFQMLMEVDASIRDAMAGLGDDLARYIEEAKKSPDERMKEEKEKRELELKREKKHKDFLQQMKEEFKISKTDIMDEFGITEVKNTIKGFFKEDKKELDKQKEAKEKGKSGDLKKICYTHYNNFKKANKFLTW